MKIAFGIEYDGGSYRGWQIQSNTPQTIQEHVEKAIVEVANHPVRVICAGRTDAGVHATGQVIHFESDSERAPRSWLYGVNANLAGDIRVQWSKVVDESFHARFSAIRRRYCYIIDNSRFSPMALNRRRSCWVYEPLNVKHMQQAANMLIGEQDFTSFRTVKCQAKSPVKTIYSLDIMRSGKFIQLRIEANAFLHHMVRNIAGVLIAIGSGNQTVEWCEQVLKAKDRTRAGVTAKASGLYLTGVSYPENFAIPEENTEILLVL